MYFTSAFVIILAFVEPKAQGQIDVQLISIHERGCNLSGEEVLLFIFVMLLDKHPKR